VVFGVIIISGQPSLNPNFEKGTQLQIIYSRALPVTAARNRPHAPLFTGKGRFRDLLGLKKRPNTTISLRENAPGTQL
jgi:hypothetical protein